MLSFRVEVDGVETMNRAFNRVDGFISDFRNVWPYVTTEFYQIEKEQFDTEGAAGASGKWAPLSPAYKKWKEQHFPGQPILKLTNALSDALTSPDALDSIYIPEKDQLTMGAKVPYGRVHQRTRPPISFTEQQKRRLQKAIQRGLVEFTRKAGFQVIEGDKAA